MPPERKDKIGFGNLTLIQKPGDFCYGVDAVIISDFAAKCKKPIKKAADMGTGTGIIPLILSYKTRIPEIVGFEIQKDALELARRNVSENGLDSRIKIVDCDIKNIPGNLCGTMDMVVTNPPYVAVGSGLKNPDVPMAGARHEITADMNDFFNAAAKLLKNKGDFYMVHRPSRLTDLLFFARKNGLEPKEMRLVCPDKEKTANIVMLHCTKGGGKELKILKPLFIYDMVGNYSREIMGIYERECQK